jgi:hypothetical protein
MTYKETDNIANLKAGDAKPTKKMFINLAKKMKV